VTHPLPDDDEGAREWAEHESLLQLARAEFEREQVVREYDIWAAALELNRS